MYLAEQKVKREHTTHLQTAVQHLLKFIALKKKKKKNTRGKGYLVFNKCPPKPGPVRYLAKPHRIHHIVLSKPLSRENCLSGVKKDLWELIWFFTKEAFSTLPICSIFCQTHEMAVWHQHHLPCSSLSCIDLSANLDEGVLDCRWIMHQEKAILPSDNCICDWPPSSTQTAWDLQNLWNLFSRNSNFSFPAVLIWELEKTSL